MKCLSMYKTDGPPAMVFTTCLSQILSNKVFPIFLLYISIFYMVSGTGPGASCVRRRLAVGRLVIVFRSFLKKRDAWAPRQSECLTQHEKTSAYYAMATSG
jgi:hypothetical protein